jgi:hypothetical protein
LDPCPNRLPAAGYACHSRRIILHLPWKRCEEVSALRPSLRCQPMRCMPHCILIVLAAELMRARCCSASTLLSAAGSACATACWRSRLALCACRHACGVVGQLQMCCIGMGAVL